MKLSSAKKQASTALYGLPETVRYCARCTISNQRPSSAIELKNTAGQKKETIAFHDDGVCAACHYAELKEKIDWKEREAQLLVLCDTYRSRNGSYDCIVPGSGGKDSVYTAHILKYKYKMNPLTVTWTPHMYTPIGWENLQSWINSGFDNVLFSPNGKLHRLLTRLAFENLLHPFQPFIIGQRLIGPRIAVEKKIPLVFYGENQAEYGNKVEENQTPTMANNFFSMDRQLDKVFLGGLPISEVISKYGFPANEFEPYLPVDRQALLQTGVRVHYLGYYLKWDPQECFYYASEKAGFKPNTERTEGSYTKYSSIDDKLDPFHYYTTLVKFGIGRATYDTCQEIRNGKITREEGVALVRKYDTEFPQKYFQEVLEYMGISKERFWEVIDAGRSPHLWVRENGEWKLRKQIT